MTSFIEVKTVEFFLNKGQDARGLLNLRLTGNVKVLFDLLSSSVDQELLLLSELLREKYISHFLLLLNTLECYCQNYDFSLEFASYGGHLLLKKILRCHGYSSDIVDAVEEVIGSTVSSGCYFPTKSMISSEPSGTAFSPPTIHKFGDDNIAEFSVYLRKIPLSMYGAGQHAVGYILWSSAVILSRFLVSNKSILSCKTVLECGAGLG